MSPNPNREPTSNPTAIDYQWFSARFENLLSRLATLESAITTIEQTKAEETNRTGAPDREFYSTPEFAALVDRNEYTVREWCRLGRVNAEKADCGRGDAKSWKIPVSELNRYRDHGLLPLRY